MDSNRLSQLNDVRQCETEAIVSSLREIKCEALGYCYHWGEAMWGRKTIVISEKLLTERLDGTESDSMGLSSIVHQRVSSVWAL